MSKLNPDIDLIGEDEDITYPLATLDTPEEREDVSGNTADEDVALKRVMAWWDEDSAAKADLQLEFEEIYKLYSGDHWRLKWPAGDVIRSDEEMVGRPNSVENAVFSLIEGEVAEFAQDFELLDSPSEKNDEAAAQKLTQLKRYLFYKNDITAEYLKWLHHFFWNGTGIWGPRWDPEWNTGQGPCKTIGDIRIESIHPQTIFPDARCGEDINNGFRIHKAVYRPIEYIRQNYPERGHLVKEEIPSGDDVLGISEITDDGEAWTQAQPGVVRLLETWYIGKPMLLAKGEEDEGEGLHVIWWVGEEQQAVYLRHANYMYFEPGESPYFPFFFGNCYTRENSPFGYGEAHYLKVLQIMLNKLSEIAMEGAALQALGQTYVKEGAVSEEQQEQIDMYGNIPGWWIWVDEPENIQHISGSGVPGSLLNDIQRRIKMMEMIIGRFDITQGKTPGSVTAFRALSLLAERAQVRLRPKEQTIRAALVNMSRFVTKLIGLFYNERRVYRLLGEDDEFEDGEFNPDRDLQRVWVKGTNNVFPKDSWQPAEGMQEGKDYEYFIPDFDTRCHVSRTLPMDRVFNMEMARDLLGAKLITPEIFFGVMEQGRFPSWDSVREQVEGAFQQVQPQTMQPRPPEVVAPEAPQEITPEALLAMLPPAQQQQLVALPPAQQQQVLAEMAAAVGGGPGGPQG